MEITTNFAIGLWICELVDLLGFECLSSEEGCGKVNPRTCSGTVNSASGPPAPIINLGKSAQERAQKISKNMEEQIYIQ